MKNTHMSKLGPKKKKGKQELVLNYFMLHFIFAWKFKCVISFPRLDNISKTLFGKCGFLAYNKTWYFQEK